MGTVPTKEAIIGQFINGRNATDDFLQLADNHGGTVFGWIDANGDLQGTLATSATPGGSTGDVQFNNNGVLGGIPTTGTGDAVLADSPALTGTPSAPTPAAADNSTKIATTAFVKNQGFPNLVTNGLMAQYEILPTETPAALVDYSGNGNNAIGTTGSAPTIIPLTGGLQFNNGGAVILPAALNAAVTVQIFFAHQGVAGGTEQALLTGNNNSTSTLSIILTADDAAPSKVDPLMGGMRPDILGNGISQTESYDILNGVGMLTLVMGNANNDQLFLNANQVTDYSNSPQQGNSLGIQTTGSYQLGGAATGAGGWAFPTWLTGQIYYALFYNRALTQAEISSNVAYVQNVMNARGVASGWGSTSSTDEVVFQGTSITGGQAVSIPPTNYLSIIHDGAAPPASPVSFVNVQNASAFVGAASAGVAYGSNNTAGNLLVALVAFGAGHTFTSLTDTQGNTWVQAGKFITVASSYQVGAFYVQNCKAGANTVTVATVGSGNTGLGILEYSGASTTTVLDAFNSGTATGTAMLTGPVPVTIPNDLLIGIFFNDANTTMTAGSGYTNDLTGAHFFTSEYGSLAGVPINGYTASGTLATSANWGGFLLAFRMANSTVGAALNLDNQGMSGSTSTKTSSSGATSIDTLMPGTGARAVFCYETGTNDIEAGATPAAVFANIAYSLRLRKQLGWKTAVQTMISRTGVDAAKNSLNYLIRRNWENIADALIDLAADPNLGADGAYANTTYFKVDGIHPNQTSVQNIQAPLINVAVNRLLGNRDFSSARTYTASATQQTDDVCQILGGSSSSQTFTLLSSIGYTGQKLYFKNTQATNAWTIAPFSGETIDGNSSISLAAGASVTLECVLVSASAGGSNWITV